MNSVVLIGRLTKDPELRYTEAGLAVARFGLAVDRQTKEKGVDFINIVVFGKQAENCEKYIGKGRQVAIKGHIQTGSYTNQENKKIYTTDVAAEQVEFLGTKSDTPSQPAPPQDETKYAGWDDADDDIPF